MKTFPPLCRTMIQIVLMTNVLTFINKVLTLYSLLKTKTIKRKYVKRDPWMTKALINSSVTKIKLLKTKLKYSV